jgi:hypothetical protein
VLRAPEKPDPAIGDFPTNVYRNHFSPQYNFETAGLLATKFGMAPEIHLKKQARKVWPRPSASVAALVPLQRRGGRENTFLYNQFSPLTLTLTLTLTL